MRLPALLALLAIAGMADARDWPALPVPEGANGQWVARDMVNNGVRMRVARYALRQGPAEVIAFYRQQWPGQISITEFGDKTLIGHAEDQHFITIELSGRGTGSEAQVSMSRISPDKPTTRGQGFLMPSGAQVLNDMEHLDEGSRTISMLSALSPFQGEAFYRNRLPAQGWTREPGGSTCSMAALRCLARYSRGKQQITLTFDRTDNGTSIVAQQTGK